MKFSLLTIVHQLMRFPDIQAGIQEKVAISYTAGATRQIMGGETNLTASWAISTVSIGFHLAIQAEGISYSLIISMKIVNLLYWSLSPPLKMDNIN